METKPVATVTSRSPLFDEIIENDRELRDTKAQQVIHFSTASRLRSRKLELIRAAERALSWNADKGAKR
jgi:hypothetical protein